MLTPKQREKITYLSQYKYLNSEMDRKLREIETWKSKLYSITGTLSDMPKSKNRTDKIADGVCKINEIEDSLNTDISNLIEVKNNIEQQLNLIQDMKLREIMKCRYLDCMTWEEIAYRNGISWQWVYKLHEKALDKIKI